VVGGSKTVIIRFGKTSPDCGVRIYGKIVIIRWEDFSGMRREDLL
jgi:hypothetical protein